VKISLINTIAPRTPKVHRIQKCLRHSCRSWWDVFGIMYQFGCAMSHLQKRKKF